jgi:uncharacterized protein YcbK (DUF882 family)
MIQTIKLTYLPLRRSSGMAFLVMSGYRPVDYNVAVDGASDSRHTAFEAIDWSVYDGTAAQKRSLALRCARYFLEFGDLYAIGFGAYGTEAPSVHMDTGFGKRTWREADYWIDQARRVA